MVRPKNLPLCITLIMGFCVAWAPALTAAAEAKTDNSAAREWPLFRGDVLADGVAKSPLPADPQVLWKFSSKDHGFEATVAIADDLVRTDKLTQR